MPIRDRIKELRRVPASELQAHPKNWRVHPDFQRRAMSELLSEIGSGTTLIAAEKLSRRCYAMEIEPRYVDVAIRRWEDYTGQKAELIA